MKHPTPESEAWLDARLQAMPQPWRAILEPHLRAAATLGVFVDLATGTLLLGKQPELGSFAFQVRLFAGLTEQQVLEYERVRSIRIPIQYRELLLAFNGGFFHQLSLNGLDHFLLAPTANPRPSPWHCRDLWSDSAVLTGNDLRPGTQLIIGRRSISLDATTAFAAQVDGTVIATSVLQQRPRWPCVEVWLGEELRAAEAFAPLWSRAMANLLKSHAPQTRDDA